MLCYDEFMNLRDRIQTWAADRFDSVQYPHVRRVRPEPQRTVARTPLGSFIDLWNIMIGMLGLAVIALLIGIPLVLFVVFFLVPAIWEATFG